MRYQSSAAVSAKLVPFKLTDIGEGIAEVELLKWFVKVGTGTLLMQILGASNWSIQCFYNFVSLVFAFLGG